MDMVVQRAVDVLKQAAYQAGFGPGSVVFVKSDGKNLGIFEKRKGAADEIRCGNDVLIEEKDNFAGSGGKTIVDCLGKADVLRVADHFHLGGVHAATPEVVQKIARTVRRGVVDQNYFVGFKGNNSRQIGRQEPLTVIGGDDNRGGHLRGRVWTGILPNCFLWLKLESFFFS